MFKIRRIRVFVFDLDGTLIDSAFSISLTLNYVLNNLNLPSPSQNLVKTWIGDGVDTLIDRVENWLLEIDPEYYVFLKKKDLHKVFRKEYGFFLKFSTYLFPYVFQTLDTIYKEKIPMVLITNKSKCFTIKILDLLMISQFFSSVISENDVSNRKPHPEALFLVSNQFNCLAKEIAVVGDSCNDIKAAQASGCLSIGVSYGYNYGKDIKHSNPNYVIDCFHEILNLSNIDIDR